MRWDGTQTGDQLIRLCHLADITVGRVGIKVLGTSVCQPSCANRVVAVEEKLYVRVSASNHHQPMNLICLESECLCCSKL